MRDINTNRRSKEMKDLDMKKEIKPLKKLNMGIIIALGIAVGAAVDNIGLGLGMGIAIAAIVYFFKSISGK